MKYIDKSFTLCSHNKSDRVLPGETLGFASTVADVEMKGCVLNSRINSKNIQRCKSHPFTYAICLTVFNVLYQKYSRFHLRA